jgi:hypothetical protein
MLLLPVEMLPPYMPSAAEKADPVLYAANIRKLIVSGWLAESQRWLLPAASAGAATMSVAGQMS